jgi:hypothetical protein
MLELVTAVANRDDASLSEVAQELEARQREGAVPEAEGRAMRGILDAGRAGRWADAESGAFALRDAQEPTAADLERLRRREMFPMKPRPEGGRGGPAPSHQAR